jgi:hypothetical protein
MQRRQPAVIGLIQQLPRKQALEEVQRFPQQHHLHLLLLLTAHQEDQPGQIFQRV